MHWSTSSLIEERIQKHDHMMTGKARLLVAVIAWIIYWDEIICERDYNNCLGRGYCNPQSHLETISTEYLVK